MTAAIAAKNAGANVTVVERNSTAGRKIAATGNGRCNFTNAVADDIAHYYSQNKAFVEGVLKRFTVTDMLELFDMLGATPNLEEDGKYFPLSGQASSVAELFERFLKKNGIDESEAEADFALAKIIKNVHVGRKYTFFVGACNWDMFKNTDLVWAYYYRHTGRYSVSRINAYHYNKKASYINLSRAVAEEVLEYYAQILPQIIVGYSADLEKEYMKNFNTFLSHRYNPAMTGQNDTVQTAASEDKESGIDTYSPVFKETGEYAVKLTYVNQERLVAAIKAVREMGGYGLAEAKDIVENSGVVLKNVSYNAAEEANKVLAQFDCTVDIVNVIEL